MESIALEILSIKYEDLSRTGLLGQFMQDRRDIVINCE